MSSSVSPIVANLYMEGVESTALGSFKWTAPVLGYRYAADTWVAIKTQEVEASTKQIHSSGLKQMFTRKDSRILDCVVGLEAHTHTDQYLLSDSHHPVKHNVEVIRSLQHQAENISSKEKVKEKEHTLKESS